MKIIELQNFSFIRIKGPDALTFLQGQVTCDMGKLEAGKVLKGAACNLQGRVIANFDLVLDGEDCLIRTQLGMAEILIKTLKKYAIFSKVELILDRQFTRVLGLFGEEGEKLLQETLGAVPKNANNVKIFSDAIITKRPGATERFEVWIRGERSFDNLKTRSEENESIDSWKREDMLQGIFHITPKNSEKYTPQILNYDISGVIDFKKGCYTGQEIIARMYYRGKPKKRLFLIVSDKSISNDPSVIYTLDNKNHEEEILEVCNASAESKLPTLIFSFLKTQIIDKDVRLNLSTHEESSLRIQPFPEPPQEQVS